MARGVNFQMKATNRASPAIRGVQKSLSGLVKAQASATRSSRGFGRGMNANRRIIQNVGFQISDLGVQIAGGQSALLSLTQNVPQVVQMFGAWGAILAGVITLIGTFAIVMTKSGKGLADVAGAFGIAEAEVRSFIAVMDRLKESTFDAINFVVNNLDTLFITLSLVASYMVGKFITNTLAASAGMRLFGISMTTAELKAAGLSRSMILMNGAIGLTSKALVVMRKALLVTGIGALIVGAGYLIERLMTLRQATGSWGAAIAAIGELLRAVFARNAGLVEGFVLKSKAMFLDLKASFLQMLALMSAGLPDWANAVLGTILGVVDGAKEGFSALAVAFSLAKAGDFKGAALVGKNLGKIVAVGFNKSIEETRVAGSLGQRLLDDSNDASAAASKLRASADQVIKPVTEAWDKFRLILKKTDDAQNKFDLRNLFGGKKKGGDAGGKKNPVDQLVKSLERARLSAKRAIGLLGATLSDTNIDFSLDRIKDSISSLSDIPAPRMDKILSGVEMIRASIKSLAAPIQAEKEKLDAILSSDLKSINPDKFLADTLEITTKIQELTQPIRQEIAAINQLDPRLQIVDTDFFDKSLTDSVTSARSQMDRLREAFGQLHDLPAVKIPEIDTSAVEGSVSRLMEFFDELGESFERSFKQNVSGLIRETTSLRDALSSVLDSIASKISDFAVDSFFSGLFKSSSGGIGGLLGSFFGSAFSFDGGGFTGKGSRSGGVDGKGGFPAILHPNETVVDHTKTRQNPNRGDISNIATGYSSSPGQMMMSVTNINNFNGVTKEEVMNDVNKTQKELKRQIEKEMPSRISKNRFNRERGLTNARV